MKCHYEILEVDRNADSDEIKKKYRKLALKWHPDKNPDNIEECTKFFALLQQAYEVLSDPQERDFYDRHRESILKGGFDGEYKDKSLDLFKYFSTQCYKGYESDEKGFFAVYRKVFQTLANEDYDEMEKHEEKNYPEFGDANSDYEKVVGKFYGFWSSFTTIRSFAWLDQYDIRQASNRWETRKIEQENKKFRDVGKQERNEQIRQLVSFVRKRDPRVKAYKELLEKKQEEAKMKQIENRKKQILQNQLQFSENKEAEAATLAHLLEVSMQMAENDSCSDECDEDGQQLPFCVVCNKSFKTENAKINHENSKLHIKQLNELKKHMKEEDALLLEASPALKEAEKQQKEKKNKRKDRKKGNGIFDYEDNGLVQTSSTSEVPETSVIDNKIEEIISKEEEEEKAEEETEIKKEKKKRRADKNKAAANIEAGEGEKTEDMIQKTGKCDRCKQVFESRSKLFAHLKLTGHATLLVNKKSEPNKKGKKNKKKDDDESW